MTPEDILTRVGDQLSIRRVFGEPVERDGIEVIPVVVAIDGGGGGTGPDEQGSGGGFGGVVRGIGVYTIANGQVRFIPAVDTTALAAMACSSPSSSCALGAVAARATDGLWQPPTAGRCACPPDR